MSAPFSGFRFRLFLVCIYNSLKRCWLVFVYHASFSVNVCSSAKLIWFWCSVLLADCLFRKSELLPLAVIHGFFFTSRDVPNRPFCSIAGFWFSKNMRKWGSTSQPLCYIRFCSFIFSSLCAGKTNHFNSFNQIVFSLFAWTCSFFAFHSFFASC